MFLLDVCSMEIGPLCVCTINAITAINSLIGNMKASSIFYSCSSDWKKTHFQNLATWPLRSEAWTIRFPGSSGPCSPAGDLMSRGYLMSQLVYYVVN